MENFSNLMDPSSLTLWGLVITGVCFLSGLFPLVNAEIFVAGAALLVPSNNQTALVMIAPLAALGQMLAKLMIAHSAMFVAGFAEKKIKSEKSRWDEIKRRLSESRKSLFIVILSSSSIGFPPLLLVSAAVGTLESGLSLFFFTGFFGRLVRFGVLVAFPSLVKELIA